MQTKKPKFKSALECAKAFGWDLEILKKSYLKQADFQIQCAERAKAAKNGKCRGANAEKWLDLADRFTRLGNGEVLV